MRNDGAPGLAFWGMCAGAAANIFLDWLFIFPLQMGIKGAAIASGLGQLLSFLLLISHFVRKKGDLRIGRFEDSAALIGKICKRGVPECVSQLNTPVTALCYNWVLMNTLGDMGVSTFSILSFIYSLANAILSGVAQGLQPLWGQAFGQKDHRELRAYLAAGMKINEVCAVVIYALLVVFRVPAVRLFNSDPTLVEMASLLSWGHCTQNCFLHRCSPPFLPSVWRDTCRSGNRCSSMRWALSGTDCLTGFGSGSGANNRCASH